MPAGIEWFLRGDAATSNRTFELPHLRRGPHVVADELALQAFGEALVKQDVQRAISASFFFGNDWSSR